jgi:hypothetical protein
VSIDWGDGSAPTIVNLTNGERSFSASHQYLDDNPTGTPSDSYTIEVTVTDDDTGVGMASTPVTVDNLAPAITVLGNSSPTCGGTPEGTPITVSGAFTDVGTLDTHAATVDWGDGSLPEAISLIQGSGSGTFSGTHAYADGGFYSITVTLDDDDSGSFVLSTTAVITGAGLAPDGTLVIIGTSGDDEVTVNRQGNGIIKVHTDFLPTGNFKTFDADDVDRIMAFLCDGDDHLNVSGNFDRPLMAHGGDGDDHLNGGGGRALLIGGLGQDRLVGGRGDDVLIGGQTNIDDDPAALQAALEAWDSTESYGDRVAAVDSLLDMLDDNEFDQLTGSSGRDLFYQGFGDDLTGVMTNGINAETVL